MHKIVMEIILLILEKHGKIMEKSWNCVFEFLWEPWKGYYFRGTWEQRPYLRVTTIILDNRGHMKTYFVVYVGHGNR